MSKYINILDICHKATDVLGPGNRFILWVQGCPFNCKSCATPDGIPIVPNKLFKLDTIIQLIIKNKNIDGITISGGEPFLQASKLYTILNKVLLVRPKLNVIVYTGFKYDSLDWKEAKKLLTKIDLLIDGPYIDSLNNNKGLRGSVNQNFIFLTERLKPYKEYFYNSHRKIEVHIDNFNQTIIGIPNKQILKTIL